MAQMNLSNIMDGLAAKVIAADITAGTPYNVYPFPPLSITVPCAIVGYPTAIDFDTTFQRGSDTVDIPVWFVVGRSTTKAARDKLSSILTGVGSIKTALDGPSTFGDIRVVDAAVETITIGLVDYLSARFDCEVLC